MNDAGVSSHAGLGALSALQLIDELEAVNALAALKDAIAVEGSPPSQTKGCRTALDKNQSNSTGIFSAKASLTLLILPGWR